MQISFFGAALALFVCLTSPVTNNPSISPAKPASVENFVLQSTDNGLTWHDASDGLPEGLFPGRLFGYNGSIYLNTDQGLYHSRNAPYNPLWEKEFFLMDRIRTVFSTENSLFGTCEDGTFVRKVPGTDMWAPVAKVLNYKQIHKVWESEGALFVGCDAGIYKSDNGGKSFDRVFDGRNMSCFTRVNGAIFSGGFDGMARSTDGGNHWEWMLKGAGYVTDIESLPGGKVAAIFEEEGRVSSDNGKTWPRMYEPVQHIFDIKSMGNFIFCSNKSGIMRSADNGKSWELMYPYSGKKWFLFFENQGVIYATLIAQGC